MSSLHAEGPVQSCFHFENLTDTIEHARTATQPTSVPTNTTPVESIMGSSTAPISSQSASSTGLVPLARGQKLEA